MTNPQDEELQAAPVQAVAPEVQESDRAFDRAWEETQEAVPYDALTPIGLRLITEFSDAERMRQPSEESWLKSLRQYKGIYEPDVAAALTNRSSAYKRLTAQKVDIATSMLLDLLFPASKERNFSVEASPKPILPPFRVQEITKALGAALQGQPIPPAALEDAIKQAAEDSAARMEEVMADQLAEMRYPRQIKQVLFSGNLYGTGILKGPLAKRESQVSYAWDEKKNRWGETVRYSTRPIYERVPVWRFYPDMEATELEHCRYVWQHHRLTKAALLELAERKGFNKEALIDHAQKNTDGRADLRAYEAELRALGDKNQTTASVDSGLYDVFERYGWIDASELQQCGVQVPAERLHEVVFANLWMLPDGEVVRAQLMRQGASFPFHLYQFREDESCIFAEGIGAIARDDQDTTNAAVRAALDNAALSAGSQFVCNVAELAPGTDYTSIHPRKVWLQTKGDSQYSPVKAVDLPNHTQWLLQLAEHFENSADETTMMPRFLAGDGAVQGAGATMGGLSMLLGQSKVIIKSLVTNFDEGITRPAMQAQLGWNMLYHPDNSIKGDFGVQARGASSLVAKEVRAQQAMQFNQAVPPEARKYVKWLQVARRIADAAEFDDVVMNDDEAKQAESNPMSEQMQQMQVAQAQAQLAIAQAKAADLQASAQKKMVEALESKSAAMENMIRGLYSAFQAAGLAVQNPGVAVAADEIARSAGWTDQTPQQQVPTQQGQPVNVPAPQGAQQGAAQGIETASLADGQPQ
ncbi:MAG: hypothetical protein IPO08_22920 [Xanthomonadales bacterium]|nr:hypothetical protein [Xanthomonadales bacterium]